MIRGIEEQEAIEIVIGGQRLVLNYTPFNTDVDIDEVSSIQYHNLFGEIVTVSALLNRAGILKAELESDAERFKMALEVKAAQLRKRARDNASLGGKKITIQQIDDYVLLDAGYQKQYAEWTETKKYRDIVDSLYWAVQSKDKKLSTILKPVSPDEFIHEIVEGSINGFLLKKVKL